MYCVSCEVRTQFICYVEESWPPLWSSGQSSWLQIQRSGFDSLPHQIFWVVVGLERGPLSLVSTIEELLGRKSSNSGLGNREYGHRDPSDWPRGTLYTQKLALTSSTSGGRSAGIVRSPTQAMELVFIMTQECSYFGAPYWNDCYSELIQVNQTVKQGRFWNALSTRKNAWSTFCNCSIWG
jgi:hypothetical protein